MRYLQPEFKIAGLAASPDAKDILWRLMVGLGLADHHTILYAPEIGSQSQPFMLWPSKIVRSGFFERRDIGSEATSAAAALAWRRRRLS